MCIKIKVHAWRKKTSKCLLVISSTQNIQAVWLIACTKCEVSTEMGNVKKCDVMSCDVIYTVYIYIYMHLPQEQEQGGGFFHALRRRGQ